MREKRDLECVGVCEVNAAASDEGAVEVEQLCGDVGERQVRHHAVHLESNAHVALHAVRTPYQLHEHIHTRIHIHTHVHAIKRTHAHLIFMYMPISYGSVCECWKLKVWLEIARMSTTLWNLDKSGL